MRDLLVTLIVFGAIPVVFMRPWMGILLFSWISYMNPHRLTYGFAYEFPFAMIVAVVTITAFVVGKENKKIPLTPITVLLFIFILWACITTIFALEHENSIHQFSRFIKIQLMTVLTLAMINSRDRIKWLIVVIVFSLGFYGMRGGAFSALTGGNYRVFGPEGSFIEDNNQLALALIMTMPFMHYLQLISEKRWMRHGLSFMMLLTLAAIIGTYSRGALLALSTMGFFLWLRSRQKVLIAIAAIICVVGVFSFMPQKWFDRMDTVSHYEKDASATGRIDSWIFAINLANDRLLGGGFKVNTREDLWPIYNPDAFKPRAPHSIYFEVLGEHGWIGLVIFLSLGFAAVFTCSRTQRLARDRPDLKWASDLVKMAQVSLIGYASAGAFLNLATFDLYYHVLAIIVIAHLTVKRAVAAPLTTASADAAVGEDAAGTATGSGTLKPGPGDLPRGKELGGASGYLIRRR